jgi:hypothetical protein
VQIDSEEDFLKPTSDRSNDSDYMPSKEGAARQAGGGRKRGQPRRIPTKPKRPR